MFSPCDASLGSFKSPVFVFTAALHPQSPPHSILVSRFPQFGAKSSPSLTIHLSLPSCNMLHGFQVCQVRFCLLFSTAIVLFNLFPSLDILLSGSAVPFVLLLNKWSYPLKSASGSYIHHTRHNPTIPVVTLSTVFFLLYIHIKWQIFIFKVMWSIHPFSIPPQSNWG